MKNKKIITILLILTVLVLIIALIFGFKNKELRHNKIKIIDVTENCKSGITSEKFYEDDTYIYLFPCVKSSSVFVKLADGNKMLVIKALEEEKITIDELINAGLEVEKKKK